MELGPRRSGRRSSVRTPLKEVKAHVDNALMAVMAVVADNENPFKTKSRILRTPPPTEKKENAAQKSTGGKKRKSLGKASFDIEMTIPDSDTVLAVDAMKRQSLSKDDFTVVVFEDSLSASPVVAAVSSETVAAQISSTMEAEHLVETAAENTESVLVPPAHIVTRVEDFARVNESIECNICCQAEPITSIHSVELRQDDSHPPSQEPNNCEIETVLPTTGFPSVPVFEEMVNLSIAMIQGTSTISKPDEASESPPVKVVPPPVDALSRYLLHPKEFTELLKSFRSPPRKKVTSARKSSEKKVLHLSSGKKHGGRISVGNSSHSKVKLSLSPPESGTFAAFKSPVFDSLLLPRTLQIDINYMNAGSLKLIVYYS